MTAAHAPAPALSCVILTRGDRPAELTRAITSAHGQQECTVEVVVVGNGAPPGALEALRAQVPGDVRFVALPANVGIPAGRNHGVAHATGEVVLFLDDDGYYPSPDVAAHLQAAFAADPMLAVVSLRVADPAGGPGERRHVPRLRAGDPLRSSEVTTFLGGACAVRRSVLDEVGGFPEGFFYAHEETDVAWRALDAGYRIRYDADAVMCHPALPPTRHAAFYRLNARNRVFLARRNLPWPLAITYVCTWAVLMVARTRSPRNLAAWFGGAWRGVVEPCGQRRPIRWRTAWRMTRLGRPPVI